jgi:katanin p60 ATPase-containing subunit A1
MGPDIDFERLVDVTEGYSGADISNVCREAAMMPLRKKLLMGGGISADRIKEIKQEAEAPLAMEDFLNSLKNIQKSVGKETLDDYAKWMAEFGSV